ncbi:MAG: hypothetical protein AB7V62_10400 [Thermoleophilia bacterium]
MSSISPAEMSALTAMAASLQQQRAVVLPLLQGLPAAPPAPAPGQGARVDVRA